jgi:SAM-dependent methyltransferase
MPVGAGTGVESVERTSMGHRATQSSSPALEVRGGCPDPRGVCTIRAVSTQDQDNDLTLAGYEAAADRYLEHSAPPGPEMVRYLDRYADLVGSGRVLELGSGPGWDALHLEERGVQVTRSDATQAFLTRLRAAGHDALHLDVRTGDLGGPWDGLLADAVLLHVSRPQLKEFLDRARSAVSEGGVLGFTLKEGDGSAWTTDKLEWPRHFTYWREPALREVLAQTGWTVRHLHHVAGRHEPWLYVCALASQQW